MKLLKNRLKPQLLVLSLLLLLINSCSGQSTNPDDCKKHLHNASILVRSYSATMDTLKLKQALDESDQSLLCPETRDKAISFKITILQLLKHYKTGYEYVASLKKSEGNYKYKKAMSYDYFRALDYGSRSDTVNEHIYFRKAADTIQRFINNENSSVVDKEAYYDLFVTMKIFLGEKLLLRNKLDTLKRNYPNDAEFWAVLEDTFIFENQHSASPTFRKYN